MTRQVINKASIALIFLIIGFMLGTVASSSQKSYNEKANKNYLKIIRRAK